MDDRKKIARELEEIEHRMKELEIRYEQYFAGVEKREPMKDREALARQIRQFANRRIMQTDLRFRYQNLATRFHSYSGNWDRILRLMDEGKFVRQTGRPVSGSASEPAGRPEAADEVDSVYRELVAAHRSSQMGGNAPDRRQVADLLQRQRAKIREKFGDREVEFRVVTENGKPKIKVRAKR